MRSHCINHIILLVSSLKLYTISKIYVRNQVEVFPSWVCIASCSRYWFIAWLFCSFGSRCVGGLGGRAYVSIYFLSIFFTFRPASLIEVKSFCVSLCSTCVILPSK